MSDDVELKPYAVTFSQQFDYEVRAEALRILGSGLEIGLAPDDTLAHPRLPEVLICLCYMAFGGYVDYYDGDSEAAAWTVMREHVLCSELANLENEIETLGRTPTLKRIKAADDFTPQASLPIPEECRAQVGGPPWRPTLPPGLPASRLSLRGLAELRRRAAEELNSA